MSIANIQPYGTGGYYGNIGGIGYGPNLDTFSGINIGGGAGVGLNVLNGFTNLTDVAYASGYFRNDGCYGYGCVYGPGDGYGSIHNGYTRSCCGGGVNPYNRYYGPGAALYRNRCC
jgi:hypothetical protein